MDVLDYRCSEVTAAGITQGLGINSLHGGWICWDDKVRLEFTGSRNTDFRQILPGF